MKTQIIIIVEQGCVTQVLSEEPHGQVLILDADVQDDTHERISRAITSARQRQAQCASRPDGLHDLELDWIR